MQVNRDRIFFEDVVLPTSMRNFRGEGSRYNRAGDRNFIMVLPNADVERCKEMGLNVKQFKAREDVDGEPDHYVKVAVKYRNIRGEKTKMQPDIFTITSGGRKPLVEDTVAVLDQAQLDGVDVIVRMHHWELETGATGTSLYCEKLAARLVEDDFDRKYAQYDVEESF